MWQNHIRVHVPQPKVSRNLEGSGKKSTNLILILRSFRRNAKEVWVYNFSTIPCLVSPVFSKTITTASSLTSWGTGPECLGAVLGRSGCWQEPITGSWCWWLHGIIIIWYGNNLDASATWDRIDNFLSVVISLWTVRFWNDLFGFQDHPSIITQRSCVNHHTSPFLQTK